MGPKGANKGAYRRMARRRKGEAISGWVVLDKPAGLGSTDAVTRVRRALNAQKAGHAGTLDPAATGVLVIALGEATKAVPHIMDADKTYLFTIRWGAETDTDDAEGAVLRQSPARPDPAAIEAALDAFRGDILQVPPQVSAVRVDGARAYDLAREGIAMDLGARPLHVARLTLIDCPDPDHAVLEMVCGKGGYVRAIARDLGRALGCLGHVAHLRRLRSGPFDVKGATPPEVFAAGDEEIAAQLRPLAAGLAGLPQVTASASGAARLRHGNPGEVVLAPGVGYGDLAWASYEGEPVALGRYMGGMLHPDRVFVQPA